MFLKQESESRFESFFEEASIALFEEDFSAVMARLSPLAASGELDEVLLLADDKALVKECVALTRVVAINAEARRFFTIEDGSLGPGTEPGSAIDPNFADEGWLVFARELLALVRGELPFESELPLVLPHGGDRTITIRVSVAPEAKSSLSRVFVSFLDITRQKRVESALKSSIEENRALIRELRHRTRNNMQMISSLLRFEEERAPDAISASAFRSINDRIEAMAMVHETLSSSGELSRVLLSSYASELVGLFVRNRGQDAARVTASVEAEQISLPIDAAVPFGLAVGELVTNALRHAFHGREWAGSGFASPKAAGICCSRWKMTARACRRTSTIASKASSGCRTRSSSSRASCTGSYAWTGGGMARNGWPPFLCRTKPSVYSYFGGGSI